MKKLTRRQLIFYGMAGIGPNILNLMVGAYLCDALYTQGFSENIESWTYLNKDLIVVAIWGVMITIAEPDLSVLANQVSSLMNGNLLIVTVGIGVGIFLLRPFSKSSNGPT